MECWQVTVTICQHIIIILHTILVSTRDFVTAKPRNKFLRCCHVFKKKAKAIELPFFGMESGKKEKQEIVLTSTRNGLTTDLPLATKGYIYLIYTQQELEEVVPHNLICRGNFVALFINADHIDQKAICIVSYPVYYHFYPAACISGSITRLRDSLPCALGFASYYSWWYLSRLPFSPSGFFRHF